MAITRVIAAITSDCSGVVIADLSYSHDWLSVRRSSLCRRLRAEWHCAQPTPALRALKVCPIYLIIRELTGMPPVVRIGDGPAERDVNNDLHT